MSPADTADLTLSDAAAAIRAGELLPLELTERCLARIERLNPLLNAFITVTADEAWAAARAAQDGTGPEGPLRGVPLALKDLIDMAGVPTTAGSTILANRIPTRDATVTARLKGAGAVLLGKLNMHEFAYGVSSTNPHYGDCHNPWDLSRITGGSSGGSASAVAAGLCLGSLGTDSGGSIRIPASLCGVVGLKPTYGRVSRAGVIPLAWTLDHVGPIARTVRDCALLLDVIAGSDAADPTASHTPVPAHREALDAGIKGMRIGLPRAYFFEDLDPNVGAAVEEAGRVLGHEGAELRDVTIETAELAGLVGDTIMSGEASAYHERWLRERPGDYGEDVRERLMLSALQPAAAYINAQRARTLISERWLQTLHDVDVLLIPATPITAPPIAGFSVETRVRLKRFTSQINVVGLPSLSIPCGFDGTGLPIGMQLVGRPFDEALLLRVGHTYQRVTDWHTRRPTLPLS